MMGMQLEPAQLFYEFRLNDHVPADHLLRRINRFLDLASMRTELRPFYSAIGRPSIDPELMMRMLIVGYCMGIRSERRPVRGGAPQTRLSLVLPAGSGRQGAGSLDLLA